MYKEAFVCVNSALESQLGSVAMVCCALSQSLPLYTVTYMHRHTPSSAVLPSPSWLTYHGVTWTHCESDSCGLYRQTASRSLSAGQAVSQLSSASSWSPQTSASASWAPARLSIKGMKQIRSAWAHVQNLIAAVYLKAFLWIDHLITWNSYWLHVCFWQICLLTLEIKMETTTYDYSDYSDEPYTPVTPCNRDSDNNLGAHLSILFYFMFLFSLFGNGLVLVIIHRWVVQQKPSC